MRWNQTTKNKAKNLRKQGKTYSEICNLLKKDVPKSTLSYWFKDVELPKSYFQRLKKINEKNRLKASEQARIENLKRHKLKIKNLKNKNKHLIKLINKKVGKLMLAMLYLAEGGKYPSTKGLMFGSSRSGIIKLFLALLKNCYTIDNSKFRATVNCRADQNKERLESFWRNISQIPKKQFYETRVDPRSVGKKTNKKNYKGVLKINYFDTRLQLEIQLLGQYLTEEGPVAQLVERLAGSEEVTGSNPVGSTNSLNKHILKHQNPRLI